MTAHLLGLFLLAPAQASEPETLVYLEADPLAYINRGWSVHPGIEHKGLRFDLTLVQVDFPERYEQALYDTDAFDLVTDIQGLKVDWIGADTDGPFVGVDVHHQALHFTHRDTRQAETLHALYAGVRAGWKFTLWRGLYVTPWVAGWRNVLPQQRLTVDGDTVDTNPWDALVTLHVGYHLPVAR